MARDKRPVDELSIEELERVLAARKREARRERLRQYDASGRRATPADQDDSYSESYEDQPTEQESTAELATELMVSAPRIVVDTVDYEGDPRFEDDEPKRHEKPKAPRVLTATPFTPKTSFVQNVPRKALGKAVESSRALPATRRTVLNRMLFGVEVIAVLGLGVIFFSLVQSLNNVARTTAQIQQDYEATARAAFVAPTATPIIDAPVAVLPSGHVYSDGQALVNLEEVPAEFRSQYNALQLQPPPEPTLSAESPIRIQIAALNIDSPIYYGDNIEVLKRGVGHHQNGINPGQPGNLVLSAHNDVYGEIFRYLDRLKPGDTVQVSTTSRTYTYVIEETQKVKPTDVWVLGSRGDVQQITLISCYPYRQNFQRIVVFGRLQRG